MPATSFEQLALHWHASVTPPDACKPCCGTAWLGRVASHGQCQHATAVAVQSMANCTSKFWTPPCFTAFIVLCQSENPPHPPGQHTHLQHSPFVGTNYPRPRSSTNPSLPPLCPVRVLPAHCTVGTRACVFTSIRENGCACVPQVTT